MRYERERHETRGTLCGKLSASNYNLHFKQEGEVCVVYNYCNEGRVNGTCLRMNLRARM